MKVGATFQKSTWLLSVHVYQQRMHTTVTSSCFLEGGFACYCKMAARHPYFVCRLGLQLPPFSKNEQWLTGGRRKRKEIDWQVKSYHRHFMWSLYFSISDKGAISSKTQENVPSSGS